MSKVLKKEELKSLKISIRIKAVSQDSYDEEALLEKVRSGHMDELAAIAWQFAIAGMGGRSLGKVQIGDTEHEVADLCEKNGVLTNLDEHAKLENDALTIKRLARLFRYEISAKIKRENAKSFLFRKYASNGTKPEFTFPCAEYLVEGDHFTHLKEAYSNLDKKLGTTFESKLDIIAQARGISTGPN